ncbi:hypothetical protein GCU67_09795 [Modestobacter muralis]|uniref:DUF1499 domain-containing protein n=1 Tax=Modestobacter muralis TaxID=1608614 RepID=A0A6P0ES55_9ACTN|nr:hypothetical protein [Modestobacter muralis]NEK94462.1 hypothetical protein [Modestobacter muralis]NEN51350.1 hypothetical protein [Modestobacter muralis]
MNMANTGGTQATLERYVPVPPAVVYPALVAAARDRFKFKGADGFTMVVDFASKANLLTWSENYNAQVLPAEGGSLIRVQGASKFNGRFEMNARLHKMVNGLFDDVIAAVRPR